MAKLSVQDCRKVYVGKGPPVEALRGVTFDIYEGEFVLVVGPSGSGKSTLLNLVGMLDRPTSGKIILDNIDIDHLTERARTRIRNQKLGFIFQFFNLIPELTALENVILPSLVGGASLGAAKADGMSLLKAVGLEHRMHQEVNRLSGGEMQRVSVARALVNRPAIVLADEPTGNLDSENAEAVLRIMKELNVKNHQTFILVSHDISIANMTDRAIRLRDGRIDAILRAEDVKKIQA